MAPPNFSAGMVFSGSLRHFRNIETAMAPNLPGCILSGLVELVAVVGHRFSGVAGGDFLYAGIVCAGGGLNH